MLKRNLRKPSSQTSRLSNSAVNLSLLEPVTSLKERVRKLEQEKHSAREWQRQAIFQYSVDMIKRRGKEEPTVMKIKNEYSHSFQNSTPYSTHKNNRTSSKVKARKKLEQYSRFEECGRRSLRYSKIVADMFSPKARKQLDATVGMASLTASLGADEKLRPGSPVRIATGRKGFSGSEASRGILGQCLPTPDPLLHKRAMPCCAENRIMKVKPLSFASRPKTLDYKSKNAVIYLDGSFASSAIIEGMGHSTGGSLDASLGSVHSCMDADAFSTMSPEGWSVPIGDEDNSQSEELEMSFGDDSNSIASGISIQSLRAPDYYEDGESLPPLTSTPEPRAVTPPLLKDEISLF